MQKVKSYISKYYSDQLCISFHRYDRTLVYSQFLLFVRFGWQMQLSYTSIVALDLQDIDTNFSNLNYIDALGQTADTDHLIIYFLTFMLSLLFLSLFLDFLLYSKKKWRFKRIALYNQIFLSFFIQSYNYLLFIPSCYLLLSHIQEHAVFAIPLFMNIVISIISTIHDQRYSFQVNDYLGRRSSFQFGLINTIFELVSCVYIAMFKNAIGQTIVNILLSLVSFYTLARSKPFQNKYIRRSSYFYSIYHLIFIIVLFLTIISRKSNALSLTVILIIPIAYKMADLLDSFQTSFKKIIPLIYEGDVQNYDFELRNFLQNVKLEYEDYRLSSLSLIVDQLAILHKQKCSQLTQCLCQQTDLTKKDYQTTVISGQLRSFYLHDFLINAYQSSLKQIEVKKQTLNTQLCFSYLNYLLYSSNSKVLASTELVRYRSYSYLSLREQSLMSELFKTKNQLQQKQENEKSFMAAIRYDEQIEVAEKQFQSTLKMKEELIILLYNDFIDLTELKNKAILLKQARDYLQKQLVELSRIHYQSQSLQFLLDGYINHLGFGQTKKALFKQKKSSLYTKRNYKQLNIDQGLFDKDCCIVFLTLVNRIGTIKKYQNKFSAIFGYQNKDIHEKNISMIIPYPIQKHHDQLLQRYVKGSSQQFQSSNLDGDFMNNLESNQFLELIDQQKKTGSLNYSDIKDIVSNKKDLTSRYFPILLAINAKGWAMPISLTLKFDSINQEDCGVTGLIQKLHSDYYYMQVNQDNFQIQAISEQLYTKAFDNSFIQNDIKKIHFNRFAPFLRYFLQVSLKKIQKPNISEIFQKMEKNQQEGRDSRMNFQNNENQDIFKTIIFIPKGNISEKNSYYLYDKPMMNEQQLRNQINNYSLEYYDIFATKFKFYHKEHQLFKYSIIEFHTFRKINEASELKDTLIKLQKKFQDLLQINYEITENMHYVDQMHNNQLISQANINSFIDIIEQELKNKTEDQLIQQDNDNQQFTSRYEENIEVTDRFQVQRDNRTNLIHLDPNSKMVSHQKLNENNQLELQKSNQEDFIKQSSMIVNNDLDQQMSFQDYQVILQSVDKEIKHNKQQQQSQNQQMKNKSFNQKLQDGDDKQKNNKKKQQSELKVQDKSYAIFSPNDQSYLQSDHDNSLMQMNQQNQMYSASDRNPLGVDELASNQNNLSITYSRQNYNEVYELYPKQQQNGKSISNNQQHYVDLPQQEEGYQNDVNKNIQKLSYQQQNKIIFLKDQFDEINNLGMNSTNQNQFISLLSPNLINTSKMSLNTTTSRNLLSSKSQLNNIVLQRLNEEILKETDRDRLVKMESLRTSLKNHHLEDLPLWKLSQVKQMQKNIHQAPTTLNNIKGIDIRSKIETSYIIRAEADSSEDCTDTIDRDERIKRELQERSRMVAASSRQSSHSNNTDMKRNLKKSLNSKKRNILMIVLTIFGMLALASIMTLTLFQYFKTYESFDVIKKDFNFIPWAIDLRSDYTIPLLYQGLLKLIKTGQFNSLKNPALIPTIYQRMQKSHSHLYQLYNFYQTADINDRDYFKYINDNPINLVLGIDDLVITDQIDYIEAQKVIQKVNLDYFIQTLAAYQFSVVYQNGGYTNYLEKVQVDNFKTFEEQSILVSEVAMNCAFTSNDSAVTQTLVLLVLVITVSFILITAIFPLYYYVQTNNQQSLKLFATISSDHLAAMFKPIQFTLLVSKSTKMATNFNINFQSKYKKRKNISSTSLIPKFKYALLFCGILGFVTLIIQPIVNYLLLNDFKSETSMNIRLLDTLYSIRSLLITNLALNYQYLAYRVDKDIFLYNAEFFSTQITIMNKKYVEQLNNMYLTIKQDQSKSRYSQSLYDNFLYNILSDNLCDTLKHYPQFIKPENSIDDTLCNTVRSGLLKKGFQISVKDFFSHVQSLEQLYNIQNRDEFAIAVQVWTEQTKIMEFDEYFTLLTKTIAIVKDFMINVMNDYLDYMKSIQTILLIFQIFALIFLFVFGWMNFYFTIQEEMILIKQLFSVLSIETVLENPYIISYLNK